MQEWISALETLGKRPKQSQGRTMALCPAHADTDRSLSVKESDGKVLVKCFAGCTFDEIRDALGISKPSGPPPPIRRREKPEPEEPPKPQPLPTGPEFTTYLYTDAADTPLLAVVRHDQGGGRKRFIQFTPAAGDLWLPGGLKDERPLFHLPSLQRKGLIAVVEGEKCVLACETAWPKQLTTCWAGGTNTWNRTDWEPLRGREVSLVADADSPGRKAMRELAYYLDTEMDCVVWLALPEGDGKDDVADWLEQDGVEATAARLKDLLELYVPEQQYSTEPPSEPPTPVDGDIQRNPHYRLLEVWPESHWPGFALRQADVLQV